MKNVSPNWFKHLTAEEAIAYVEDSPFGKDWEGNFLELQALSWDANSGMLEFFDGRYRNIVRFQANGTIRHIGDNNPLNMVEAALAEQRRKKNRSPA
ncbi:hypothetical protein JOC37_002001 [Desulfohalotomaculum tongense]|uniref:hypothetical protein n=1 Tax=Desulforadius tongensis TaxID=1216062 RepID=UPI0019572FE9|nr:hypothetical protein [Desulforadius tongensis]MBM7855599.1 hypothetical protein [Desulforadius tongensis]